MKIKILYDNDAKEGLISSWGFSCLVEHHGKKILFDTGWDGSILLHNMLKMGIRREDVSIIVLSHIHWDHIGGLARVLHKNAKVYLPNSFSKRLKDEIANRAEVFDIMESREILEDFYTTGELGKDINEQALLFKSKKGVVVITGCAHPGMEKYLKVARNFGGIYAVIGGFHSFDKLHLLRDIDIIAPCHCTYRKTNIQGLYPEAYMTGGAGTVIEI